MPDTRHHVSPGKERSAPLEAFLAVTEEHRAAVLSGAACEFRVRPTDVFVSTFPKCGTTWMQHIVHGLRTQGSMDFKEISQVVPFFEIESHFGLAEGPQAVQPRAYKTHLPWDLVPKGARYVHVLRDPGDALISWYHYVNGALFDRDAISIDEFALEFFMVEGGTQWGSYWSHLRSWWPTRGSGQAVWVCYEDMKADTAHDIGRVARFLGLDGNAAAMGKVVEQSKFQFMNSHAAKFNGKPRLPELPSLKTQSPQWQGDTWVKLRGGRVGDHRHALSARVRDQLAATWKREIAATLGFATYDDLRSHLRQAARQA